MNANESMGGMSSKEYLAKHPERRATLLRCSKGRHERHQAESKWKATSRGKRWTDAEDWLFWNLWPVTTLRELAARFGRTYYACQSRYHVIVSAAKYRPVNPLPLVPALGAQIAQVNLPLQENLQLNARAI